jgi:thiamine biosynthesis lipoprotein
MKSLSQVFKRARPALGTTIEISLSSPDFFYAQRAITSAFDLGARLEKVLSAFDPASELSEVNRAPPGESCTISEDLMRVLRLGAEIEAFSKGAFRLNPSSREAAPYTLADRSVMRRSLAPFDLGGVAKGYIVDRIFEELEADFPGESIVVNAGGDVRTSHPVNFEIRVPAESGEKRYALSLGRGALATSSLKGTSEVGVPSARFDETSGNSATKSVSIFAPGCAVADALTKVVLFGDSEKLCESFPEIQVFAFSEAGDLL